MVDNRVVRAKIDLMLTNPFWGSLITRLELKVWDKETFATNGKYLYCPDPKHYNPKWNFQNIIFILAHETFHCAGGHIFRQGDKKHRRWNIACDYATNALLADNGFALPDGCLYDKKYNGMTAEKIYAILPEDEGNEGDFGQGFGDPSDLEAPDAKESSVKEQAQEWKETLATGARNAKGRGALPAGLEEYVEGLLQPKVDWYTVLYRNLQVSRGQNDYCSYPFNRRHIWREIYLPSLQGESIELVCCVDSSGSISTDDFIRYFSEMRGICTIFGSYKIHLFIGDTQVNQYEVVDEDTPMPKMVQGRGGTDFRPFFERIEKEELQELPVVFFTDLDGCYPDSWSGDSVYWLVRKEQNHYHNEFKIPFGKVIEIND